jgi:hypothetical protein
MLYEDELYNSENIDPCDCEVEIRVENTIKYIKKIKELEEHFFRLYVIDLFNKSIILNDLEIIFIREIAIQRAKEFFQYVNSYSY